MAPKSDNRRLGFHYYPDTLHYRESDLCKWLPVLQELGASWITLVTPVKRAIPESFLKGLINAGIKPVLHIHAPILPSVLSDIRSCLDVYASWGVQYICFFDRPNDRSSWPASAWAQNNLVERFLDIYLPLAQNSIQAGLTPVFPPLQPGGDYWDTAFLQAALQSIQRRGAQHIAEKLVLGAYAWSANRSLNWGAGGPERWPGATPYQTKPGSEDHLGFRLFDWYLALYQSALGKQGRVILIGAGSRLGDNLQPGNKPVDVQMHAKMNLSIARLFSASSSENLPPGIEPVTNHVLACNFWLLTASPNHPDAAQAWFQEDGNTLPVVTQLRHWVSSNNFTRRKPDALNEVFHPASSTKPIQHYLLLPSYAWGISGWHFELIRPFVQKYLPTIGFSVLEASQASKVTILGNLTDFPANTLDTLLNSGCIVEQIEGDGTELATKLAEF
jgi:hypothetical protein